MTPFGTWLADIGLGTYNVVFASNKIDFDVIRSLSDADLRELGLALGRSVCKPSPSWTSNAWRTWSPRWSHRGRFGKKRFRSVANAASLP